VRRLAFILVATLAGCGVEQPDERSVSAPPVYRVPPEVLRSTRSVDASCGDFAAARCADFVLCASLADRARFADESECVAHVARGCIENANLLGVIGGAERADDCARALRALDCHDRRDPDTQLRACTRPGEPPRGALADDAPCVNDAQCAGGACVHDGERCGRCATAPTLGAKCAKTSDCGATDLICTSGACAARRSVDAACDEDAECRVGLSCIMGRCAIGTMREGEVCIAGTNACDPRDALRCLGEEWTRCVRYEVLELGASCADASLGLPVLCGGVDTYCSTRDWRCVRRLPLGAACNGDVDCVEGAACVQLDGRSLCTSMAEVCR